MQVSALVALSTLFVMLWSSGWIVSSFAIGELSAMTLISARYVVVFIALLVIVTALGQWRGHWRRLNRRTIVCHLFIGILSHATYLLAAIGSFELGVSAALVAFITALQPLITAVLSGPITHEQTTRRQWQGLLLGLSAVVLLVSNGYQNGLTLYSLFLPFVAVISLSVGSLLHKRLELQSEADKADKAPITLILLIHSIGALTILIPISASHDLIHFSFTTSQWVVVIWLALVTTLGAYGLLLVLLRHLPSMQVASLGYLVPPATMLQSYLVLGHSISLMDVAGLCVASMGVYLVMKPVESHPKDSALTNGQLATLAVMRNRQHVDIEL